MGQFINAVGQHFGKWTIIEDLGRNKVRARCDCGFETIYSKYSLRHGKSQSCINCYNLRRSNNLGYRLIEDLTGRKIGKLTVVKFLGGNKCLWLCKCDCGNERKIEGILLRKELRQSCGCSRLEKALKEKGGTGFNRLYDAYKRNASNRKLSFEINKEEFKKLTGSNCYYCGLEPQQVSQLHAYRGNPILVPHSIYFYNGIDRLNSNMGYSLSNVVPCCKKCNKMKTNLPISDFKDHIQKIYFNWIKK
jgi:hypothetical protein